jgi:hypothetical protein
MSVLATKQDVREVADKVDGLDSSLVGLGTAIDGLARSVDDLRVKYAAIGAQLDRHEKWIHEFAHKVGIKLQS